jgi:two-component system NarL family response regulator
MKILLVDDNKLFLDGLRNMLESHGYEIVGAAHSAEDAIRQVQALQPDLVLMDVQMPEQSGIEATQFLKQLHPLLKIVMMTVSESDEHLFDAIVAGAAGYLLKGERPEIFLDALAGLSRGETPLSPGLAAKIMAEFARRERVQPKSGVQATTLLSPRQKEIIHLVSQGKTYKDIASQLSLSERTVKYHMGEITNRLHKENRAQVIRSANKWTDA